MKNHRQSLSSCAIPTLFSCLLFFVTAEVVADGAIKPFSAKYRAYYSGVAINATRELKKMNGNIMMVDFRAKSFLIDINESASLLWLVDKPSRLTPLDYQYRRTGIGKKRHTHFQFDWQLEQVVNTREKTHIPIPPNSPVFDKLTYQLQLQHDLINGKTELDYLVVDGQTLKNYRFRIVGEELLTTELGKLATIKVERVRDNDKRTTSIWFAKDWNYLLVQLEQQEKNGDKYLIQLLNATVDGTSVVDVAAVELLE